MRGNAIGMFLRGGWDGNFASLFTAGTVVQSVQNDLGMSYSPALVSTAGNTSTTAISLASSLSSVPAPIWARSVNSASIGFGAAFNIYFDGLGITPAMSGVVPLAGVPVPLTGIGTGVSLTWSAGNSIAADSWKSIYLSWQDQSGNGHNYGQPTVSQRALVSIGPNNLAYPQFDGVDDSFFDNSLNLPAPSLATPTYVLAAWRIITSSVNNFVFGDNANAAALCLLGSTTGISVRSQSGAVGAIVPYTVGSWFASYSQFTGNVTDVLRVGPVGSTGQAGNITGGGRAIAKSLTNFPCNMQMAMITYLNAQPSAAQIAAFSAAITTKYGPTVQPVDAFRRHSARKRWEKHGAIWA